METNSYPSETPCRGDPRSPDASASKDFYTW